MSTTIKVLLGALGVFAIVIAAMSAIFFGGLALAKHMGWL